MQINSVNPLVPITQATPTRPGDGDDFAATLKSLVSDASHLQDEARNAIEAFVRGDPVELHQVMAAAEEASLALEVLVEMRNRLTEAYRTLISVQ